MVPKERNLKKVFYFTNIYPKYRDSIWQLLLGEEKYDFHIFYSGQSMSNIKSSSFENIKLHRIKNFFLFNRLFWQKGVLYKIINGLPDIIIFLGEMTILTNWVSVIICKLLNIEVWFWGHGIYGNESKMKLFFRILFLKLPKRNLLYGNYAKSLLIKKGFDESKLSVIYNSLDFYNQDKFFKTLEKKNINSKKSNDRKIIFIGRLTKKKKIDQLLKAIKLLDRNNYNIELTIIGFGSIYNDLIKLAEDLSLSKVNFLGEIYDERKISRLIYESDLCVSPGNVGLSAIHSITYGTPVITHDDFKYQMPEFEIIKPGVNGFFFKKDSVEDLARKISLSLGKNFDKKAVRKEILNKYNPQAQKSIFDKLILYD